MQTSPQPEGSRRNTPLLFGINLGTERPTRPQDQSDAQLTSEEYKKMIEQRIASPDEEGTEFVMGLILKGEESKLLTPEEALELRKQALKVDRSGVINWGQFPPTKQ